MSNPEGLPENEREALSDVASGEKIASYVKPEEAADADREQITPEVNQVVKDGKVVGYEASKIDERLRQVADKKNQDEQAA